MARQQDLSVLLYDGVSAPTIEVQEGTTSASYEIGDLSKILSNGIREGFQEGAEERKDAAE